MLGQALAHEAQQLGWAFDTLARSNASHCVDISDLPSLKKLSLTGYDLVINAAALTDLNLCEADPELADRINALAVEVLAEKAQATNAYFIQISTDHYFTGDSRLKHDENAPVKLLNAYASSKFRGERNALKNPKALVVRTNIVGWRGWSGKPTFLEWVQSQLNSGAPFTAFDDFYTSSIDVGHFSKALLFLASLPPDRRPTGILNLASSEVFSKKEFIAAYALRNRYDLKAMVIGSVKNLPGPARAESLGLDVRRAETILGHSLPQLTQVTDSLWEEYRKRSNAV